MRYAGPAPPRGEQVPWYPILGLRLNEKTDVTFLTETGTSTMQHWAMDAAKGKERSYACEDWRRKCELCGRAKRYWAAYFSVMDNATNTRKVLCVGREADKALDALCIPHGGLWMVRAVLVLVGSNKGRKVVTEPPPGPVKDRRVQAHGVMGTILRILGTDAVQTADDGEPPPPPDKDGENGGAG